jgi:hypothetical protein
MPQLDMFSWLNQVITTTAVMLVFYIVLTLIFLPTTAAILKGRTKLQLFRNLSLSIFQKQLSIYVGETSLNLATLLVNDVVYIWHFFSPSSSVQFKMEIDTMCYEAGLQHIEGLYGNLALISLLPTVFNNKE